MAGTTAAAQATAATELVKDFTVVGFSEPRAACAAATAGSAPLRFRAVIAANFITDQLSNEIVTIDLAFTD